MKGFIDINRNVITNSDGTTEDCIDILMFSDIRHPKSMDKNICVRGRMSYEDFVKALTGDIDVPIEITDFKE